MNILNDKQTESLCSTIEAQYKRLISLIDMDYERKVNFAPLKDMRSDNRQTKTRKILEEKDRKKKATKDFFNSILEAISTKKVYGCNNNYFLTFLKQFHVHHDMLEFGEDKMDNILSLIEHRMDERFERFYTIRFAEKAKKKQEEQRLKECNNEESNIEFSNNDTLAKKYLVQKPKEKCWVDVNDLKEILKNDLSEFLDEWFVSHVECEHEFVKTNNTTNVRYFD